MTIRAWTITVACQFVLGCAVDSPGVGESETTSGTVCSDEREMGDGKNPGDWCWAPPLHYCSEGAGGSITYCAPDMTLCCSLFADCPPCGWVECPETRKGCPTHIEVDVRPECQAFVKEQYRVNDPICWDELRSDAGGDGSRVDRSL
ncbi:MAG: hypothetical protein AMXMBFR64_59750 [Myxococcales bacterium]